MRTSALLLLVACGSSGSKEQPPSESTTDTTTTEPSTTDTDTDTDPDETGDTGGSGTDDCIDEFAECVATSRYSFDGMLRDTVTDTYDANGWIVLTVRDDGTSVTETTNLYDSAGNNIRSEARRGGALVFVVEFDFDGDAPIAGRFDQDGDGIWDSETIYTYVDDLLMEIEITNVLGSTITTNTYDEDGQLIYSENEGPFGMSSTTYVSDEDGYPLELRTDTGTQVNTNTYTYDACHRVLTRATTLEWDDPYYASGAEYLTTNTYDADHRLVLVETVEQPSGDVVDLRETEWVCP